MAVRQGGPASSLGVSTPAPRRPSSDSRQVHGVSEVPVRQVGTTLTLGGLTTCPESHNLESRQAHRVSEMLARQGLPALTLGGFTAWTCLDHWGATPSWDFSQATESVRCQ